MRVIVWKMISFLNITITFILGFFKTSCRICYWDRETKTYKWVNKFIHCYCLFVYLSISRIFRSYWDITLHNHQMSPPLYRWNNNKTGLNTNSKTVIAKINYYNSTIYQLTLQRVMKSDTHLFYWENVKKVVHLKLKTMSITYRFHVFDLMLTLYI